MKTNSDFWIQINDLVHENRLDINNLDNEYIDSLEAGERSALELFIMSINDVINDKIELQDRILDYEDED